MPRSAPSGTRQVSVRSGSAPSGPNSVATLARTMNAVDFPQRRSPQAGVELVLDDGDAFDVEAVAAIQVPGEVVADLVRSPEHLW